jgi:hypothetical protein
MQLDRLTTHSPSPTAIPLDEFRCSCPRHRIVLGLLLVRAPSPDAVAHFEVKRDASVLAKREEDRIPVGLIRDLGDLLRGTPMGHFGVTQGRLRAAPACLLPRHPRFPLFLSLVERIFGLRVQRDDPQQTPPFR